MRLVRRTHVLGLFAQYRHIKERPSEAPWTALFLAVSRKELHPYRETVSYYLNILDIDLIAREKIGALAAAVGAGFSAFGGLVGLPAVLTV